MNGYIGWQASPSNVVRPIDQRGSGSRSNKAQMKQVSAAAMIRRTCGCQPAKAETCFIWALFDRDPLPRWSIGRTTLLGDACHPMYPFMGQGAAQAIEDGAALAACLAAGSDDPAASLQRYERLRIPRVSQLQAMSRANKPRFHMPDGKEQQARDSEWARVSDRAPDNLRWLYDHDPAALT